jgi:predicted transport protein
MDKKLAFAVDLADAADGRRRKPSSGDVAPPARVTLASSDASGPSRGAAKAAYEMSHHTAGRPAEVVDLFEAVDEAARSLDPGVVRKIAKTSVNYSAGRRAFCSIRALGGKVAVYYVLDPTEVVPVNPGVRRDVSNLGHHGNGRVEYSVLGSDQLPEVQQLMRAAFDRAA